MIEIIRQIVKQFPARLIKHRATLFFTALSSTFAGDSSISVRETASEIILLIVEKYPSPEYSALILSFLRNESPEQKRLGCLLICLLGDSLKSELQIEQIMKLFVELFTDELFTEANDALIIAVLQGKLSNTRLKFTFW